MRRESDLLLAGIPARFDQIEARANTLEIGLASNTEMTRKVQQGTATLVAFVADVEVVWKVCKVLRRAILRVAKWATAVAVAVSATAAALHAVGAVDVGVWLRGVFR